ncbi:unnamed protein product, partial [Mycena citricolor]
CASSLSKGAASRASLHEAIHEDNGCHRDEGCLLARSSPHRITLPTVGRRQPPVLLLSLCRLCNRLHTPRSGVVMLDDFHLWSDATVVASLCTGASDSPQLGMVFEKGVEQMALDRVRYSSRRCESNLGFVLSTVPEDSRALVLM